MRSIIFILCFLFLSCSIGRKTVHTDIPQIVKSTVKFKITKSDTSNPAITSSLRISDTLHAQFSYLFPNPFSPVNIWYAYVPYFDTLNICLLSNKQDSIIAPPINQIVERGYYQVEFDSLITNSSLYILRVRFCDSTFTKKVYWIR